MHTPSLPFGTEKKLFMELFWCLMCVECIHQSIGHGPSFKGKSYLFLQYMLAAVGTIYGTPSVLERTQF
jgi:hypothetical protein